MLTTLLCSEDKPESRGDEVELTFDDRSDHDFATNPFRCPAKPVFPALNPLDLGVVNDVLPANAKLLALPENLEFSPKQHNNNNNCICTLYFVYVCIVLSIGEIKE